LAIRRPSSIGAWAGRSCVTSLRRDGTADGQIAARHEADEATFQCPAIQQDVTIAAAAAQPYVRSEAIHEPLVAAARMGAPEGQHVTKPEFDDLGPRRRH
jgi:hypothetical protein